MQNKRDPRHLRRIKVMQSLYSWQLNPHKNQSLIKIFDNLDKIDQKITILAPELPLERINPVDLAILRQAVYELEIDRTQPQKAVIDEAIELAKEFGGEGSPAFINGALAKAL